MAIEPLLEGDLLQKVVDVEVIGFSTMPSILIVQGRTLQGLRLLPDRLVGAEFVEVVVGRRILLVGQRPVEHVFALRFAG